MLEVAMLLLALMAGAVGFLIKDRLPLARRNEEPTESIEEVTDVPSRHPHEDLLPYYIDADGNKSFLAFAGADHMPQAMYYHPKTDTPELFDCHGTALEEGEEVIRWPNPLKRKVESLCEGCVIFPNT